MSTRSRSAVFALAIGVVVAGASSLVAGPAFAQASRHSTISVSVPGTGVDVTDVVDENGDVQGQSAGSEGDAPEVSITSVPLPGGAVTPSGDSGSAGGTVTDPTPQPEPTTSESPEPQPTSEPSESESQSGSDEGSGSEDGNSQGSASSDSSGQHDGAQPTAGATAAPTPDSGNQGNQGDHGGHGGDGSRG
jgi:serine/threonine-protein kinase